MGGSEFFAKILKTQVIEGAGSDGGRLSPIGLPESENDPPGASVVGLRGLLAGHVERGLSWQVRSLHCKVSHISQYAWFTCCSPSMKLKNIELPVEEIERFCEKWNLTELSLFGSVLRDDFKPESSDIDVMVQYHPQSVPSFYDLDCMEAELKLLLNRDVDVITRASVENSTNYLRRKEILSSVKVIYESQPSVPA